MGKQGPSSTSHMSDSYGRIAHRHTRECGGRFWNDEAILEGYMTCVDRSEAWPHTPRLLNWLTHWRQGDAGAPS